MKFQRLTRQNKKQQVFSDEEMIELINQGLNNSEIAEELDVCYNVVWKRKRHLGWPDFEVAANTIMSERQHTKRHQKEHPGLYLLYELEYNKWHAKHPGIQSKKIHERYLPIKARRVK